MPQEDGRCVLMLPLLAEPWQKHILENDSGSWGIFRTP